MDDVSGSSSGATEARAEHTSRSHSALNTLYHESQQEMELLRRQLRLNDNIVTDLKARLGRYESLRLAAGDTGDSVLLGPSRSLLESLCQEIWRLKRRSGELQVKASGLEEEIQRLKVQLAEKDLELDGVRRQPDHEKERELQRLRASLQEGERRDATRAVLCSSLAEEADALRAQLGATVTVCQELLARLEGERKAEGGGEHTTPQDRLTQTTAASSSANANANANAPMLQLQEENKRLRQRVSYVQGLNCQWQRYDSSREDYIRGLCLKETASPGAAALMPGLLQQEIARLNALLEDKMSEVARLGREAGQSRRQDQERIQTLEQQVLIYTEDFKSERRDRERAQSQLHDLKEQVHQLRQQLHKQQGAPREIRDPIPMCRVHIGHRISSRRHRDNGEHQQRAIAEAPQQHQQPLASAAAAAAARATPAWSDPPGLSELQCPRCQARFGDTDAAEYLRHWDECAKL